MKYDDFLSDDDFSVRELFVNNLDRLASFAYKQDIKEQDEIDELIQISWLAYLEYIGKKKYIANPSGLLFTIFYNKICDFIKIKSKKRNTINSEELEESFDKNLCYNHYSENNYLIEERRIEDEKNRELMNIILNELGEENSELLRLRFQEGKSFKELSEIYNKSDGTIRQRVSRLIIKLKKHYEELITV